MQGRTTVHGARRWLTVTAATAACVVALGALGACNPGGPDPVSGPVSPTPGASTTSAASTPTIPFTPPTETAEPLTPVTPKPKPTTTTAPPGTVEGECARTQAAYPVLSPGAKGPAVAALQCFLNDADFGPVPVDAVYGAQTRAAMARVEATYEGPAPRPGRVDAGTWVLVISRSMGDATLRKGSKGADVTTLQRALRAAGATLEIDGVFGTETKKAVERFQDANRIGADGIVGRDTLFLLKSGATIG